MTTMLHNKVLYGGNLPSTCLCVNLLVPSWRSWLLAWPAVHLVPFRFCWPLRSHSQSSPPSLTLIFFPPSQSPPLINSGLQLVFQLNLLRIDLRLDHIELLQIAAHCQCGYHRAHDKMAFFYCCPGGNPGKIAVRDELGWSDWCVNGDVQSLGNPFDLIRSNPWVIDSYDRETIPLSGNWQHITWAPRTPREKQSV